VLLEESEKSIPVLIQMTAMERWELLRETGYKILESKCISRCKCGF
jgi:hypothetical protein